ncbi:MAG: zinc ribbon domain-containing protein [Chthonomonadales bacterium]|nr:zinc ribbon domain-containing protein [Chthonomonadales bacterium]
MRCPSCRADNEEGAAFCATCAAPLTQYADRAIVDADPERTARRLAELGRQPAVVPVMAAADITCGIWFIASAFRAILSRPRLTEDATNYLVHAFGGLQAVLVGAVMLPIAAGMFVLAFGCITQRSWAWYANAGILGIAALLALSRYSVHRFVSMAAFAAVVGLAYAWLQPAVRRWYGTDTTVG